MTTRIDLDGNPYSTEGNLKEVHSSDSDVQRLVKRCLETDKPVDEPNVVTCRCKNCWSYLCDLEDAATCGHGFLAGCPKCGV